MAEGAEEHVINFICNFYDLVYFLIRYFRNQSILGNLEIIVYGCIFSGDPDCPGNRWTDLYRTSNIDCWRNHCTDCIESLSQTKWR